MACRAITVYFKQTGEHINVPVSLESTAKDIIRYVCDNSVIKDKIDYSDYYLSWLHEREILEEDETLKEIDSFTEDNPRFELCMKTAIRARIMSLALQRLRLGQDAGSENQQARVHSTESKTVSENKANSSSCGFQAGESNGSVSSLYQSPVPPKPSNHSAPSIVQPEILSSISSSSGDEKSACRDTSKFAPASGDKESNVSKPSSTLSPSMQPIQETVVFRTPKSVSNCDTRDSKLPENLAETHQRITSIIEEASAAATRDPIMRRYISNMLDEINIVLCGSPRVGKSTLINTICQKKLAKTSPGLNSCTVRMSRYNLTGQVETDSGIIDYKYNFWDTPGFQNWSQKDIQLQLETILEKPKSDILCMIYCASPGSHANLQQLGWLLNECVKRHIFCALVCTNKWAGQKAQREAVMLDFQNLLAKYHEKNREENGVIYFGNVGLCTSVNSQRYVDEDIGKIVEQSGVNELIIGIMESLDSVKVVQWCTLVFENKSVWKNMADFPKRFKSFFDKLVSPKESKQ